jgi:hypothetical protein
MSGASTAGSGVVRNYFEATVALHQLYTAAQSAISEMHQSGSSRVIGKKPLGVEPWTPVSESCLAGHRFMPVSWYL